MEAHTTARKTLTSKDEIDAFYHPVRMRILELLSPVGKSQSEVAQILGVHPANIAHHFRILADAGLIELAGIRHTGRNPAKCYRSVAKTFDVLSEGQLDHANAKVLTTVRNDIDSGIRELGDGDSETVLGYLLQKKWSRADLEMLMSRLESLIAEFAETPETELPMYSLAVAVYPTAAPLKAVGKIRIHKNKSKEGTPT